MSRRRRTQALRTLWGTLLALAASEVGRAVAIAHDPGGVQIHASVNGTSQPIVAIAWLAVATTIFIWTAPGGSSTALAFGLYLGGATANLVELGFSSGVANYIPLGGYVFSLGDVAAAIGCLLMFPGLVAAGTYWWTATSPTSGSEARPETASRLRSRT